MSQARNTLGRFLRAVIFASLLAPSALVATSPAMQSRMMVVQVHDSSAGILEAFRTVGLAVGLSCQWLEFGKDRGLQCNPPESSEKFQGLVDVVDVKESRSIVISAFSSNVSTPHGELHPALEEALKNFRQVIAGNPAIAQVTECSAPNLSSCATPSD